MNIDILSDWGTKVLDYLDRKKYPGKRISKIEMGRKL
jgi:hypothetical protein